MLQITSNFCMTALFELFTVHFERVNVGSYLLHSVHSTFHGNQSYLVSTQQHEKLYTTSQLFPQHVPRTARHSESYVIYFSEKRNRKKQLCRPHVLSLYIRKPVRQTPSASRMQKSSIAYARYFPKNTETWLPKLATAVFWRRSFQHSVRTLTRLVCCCLPQFLQVNAESVAQVTPRPFPSTFFPIHHPIIRRYISHWQHRSVNTTYKKNTVLKTRQKGAMTDP
jgi:hypothetical protein